MKASLFLLDDGFQHARLHRDLDVVVLDGLDPLAGGYVFPAGRLREPAAALRRANAIVITRSEGRRFDGLRKILPHDVPVFYGTTRMTGWVDNATGERLPTDALQGTQVYAFCGLGNPESFRRTLEQAGCIVAGFHAYPDHHPYTEADVVAIEAASADRTIVTTEKDAVRLPRAIGYSLLIEAEVPGLADFVAHSLTQGSRE
jgi:tetraacyldisaccharide 4'-kinase